MKFGKSFVTHQIPEWAVFYMNYKQLKKIIKQIHGDGMESAIGSFFFELDRDIEKVDGFFNTKYNEYSRRLDRLVHVLGYSSATRQVSAHIDSNYEHDEIINVLLDLRSLMRNLKWYGELNHKGFVKILKKLDKNILYANKVHHLDMSTTNKHDYLATRVNPLPFANGTELVASLDVISDLLRVLVDDDDTIQRSPSEEVPDFDDLLARDDGDGLKEFIKGKRGVAEVKHEDGDSEGSTEDRPLKYLHSILVKATLGNSRKSIDVIFGELDEAAQDSQNVLFDASDISGRNFFHQLFVNLGKKQLSREEMTPGWSNDVARLYGNKGPDAGDENAVTVEGLGYVLERIQSRDSLKQALLARDNYARTPLHYAAQYGLKDISTMVLQRLGTWGLVPRGTSVDSVSFWGDQEGLTPLHLSIIGNHPKTTANLLAANRGAPLTCPSLLLLAVRLNSLPILGSILENGVDVDYTDSEHNNETALYIAAKHNLYTLVEYLLEHNANTEIGESIFGWTPVFVAASEGYKLTVKLLLEYEAAYDIVDDSGWLPMEHACLRGHLEVADLLTPKDKSLLLYDAYDDTNNKKRLATSTAMAMATSSTSSVNDDNGTGVVSPSTSTDKLPQGASHSTASRPQSPFDLSRPHPRPMSPLSRQRIKRQIRPVKSFGHRYLNEDESLVLITMGTTDLRDHHKAVELSKVSLAKTFQNELDTALSLSVTCINKLTNEPVEPPTILDLPLEDHHGSATDPLTFKLSNHLSPENVLITFDLIPTYGYGYALRKNKRILGRAVALLKNAYTKVGPNLRSLNNSISLPILDSSSLDILGTLRFEYLCVRPFKHDSMNIERSDTYWKQLVSTRVIGHRGLGKNDGGRKSLQLGENTVESFIAAASLGASYVEFDVQLTKDFVPVVYHDFTVAESGVDIPMHAITAEQFLGLNEHNKNKKESQKHTYAADDQQVKHGRRSRSISAFSSAPDFHKTREKRIAPMTSTSEADDALDRELRSQFNSRMQLTKTWKDKGFKGNLRGSSVASNFVTLKELFKKVPKSVGFNIELKYPMLDEAEQEAMGEIAIDLNFYVDTILKVVYDENTTGRDIILSSFHPDICLLLSLKQPTMPILFLSESGTAPMADIRASSLQNAIRFAKKWNLLGIVSAAGALVKTPRLAQVVKSSGLVCVTYGTENNDPELAKVQMRAGVDAVIADSVLAVREGLRMDSENLRMLEDALSD